MYAKDDPVGTALWARDLSDDEIDRARRGITQRHYAKGSYVCHRGDSFDYWTGVVEGLVKISAISPDGKAMTFAGAGTGGWFGEGTVLKGEPRKYDLVALRDTRLALMNRATFMWLYENSAGFTRFLVRQLNERMGQFIATIEYDRILDPKARVARNLSWFFNPVLYPGAGTSIEISQEELGLLAGVSRPVVNRSLRALEAEGLLRAEHGRITVHDVEALRRYGA
jgi:CRP/FNR family transcriptional regulator, cyclic AMP receptor protein